MRGRGAAYSDLLCGNRNARAARGAGGTRTAAWRLEHSQAAAPLLTPQQCRPGRLLEPLALDSLPVSAQAARKQANIVQLSSGASADHRPRHCAAHRHGGAAVSRIAQPTCCMPDHHLPCAVCGRTVRNSCRCRGHRTAAATDARSRGRAASGACAAGGWWCRQRRQDGSCWWPQCQDAAAEGGAGGFLSK